MNQDEENPRETGRKARGRPPPTWAERNPSRTSYRRYTDRGYDGRQHIFFDFTLPIGQTRIDDWVYEVLSEFKTTDGHHTGLRTVKNPTGHSGTRWQLPDSTFGRTVADKIEVLLIAHDNAADQGRGPSR